MLNLIVVIFKTRTYILHVLLFHFYSISFLLYLIKVPVHQAPPGPTDPESAFYRDPG